MRRKRCYLLGMLIAAATTTGAQEPAELVLDQSPFRVYSAFWINLHDVLWAEAWARRPPSEEKAAGAHPEPLAASLTPEEKLVWDAAVAYYDREVADLHPVFEMAPIRTALLGAGQSQPTGLPIELQQALAGAATIYRKYWWPAHDRANRAWVADVLPKVAALSPAVPERIASLTGASWPVENIRIDVVRAGPREGAGTSLQPAPGHVTLSSGNANFREWMGAEMVLHEATHLIYIPVMNEFAAALRTAGKDIRTGPLESWNFHVGHAAMFDMVGELVRAELAERGIAYDQYLAKRGMLDREWSRFKKPLETHWRPFVEGKSTDRTLAITQTIAALP